MSIVAEYRKQASCDLDNWTVLHPAFFPVLLVLREHRVLWYISIQKAKETSCLKAFAWAVTNLKRCPVCKGKERHANAHGTQTRGPLTQWSAFGQSVRVDVSETTARVIQSSGDRWPETHRKNKDRAPKLRPSFSSPTLFSDLFLSLLSLTISVSLASDILKLESSWKKY